MSLFEHQQSVHVSTMYNTSPGALISEMSDYHSSIKPMNTFVSMSVRTYNILTIFYQTNTQRLVKSLEKAKGV